MVDNAIKAPEGFNSNGTPISFGAPGERLVGEEKDEGYALYLVRFNLDDGPHIMQINSASKADAIRHSEYILNRRKAAYPDEVSELVSVTKSSLEEIQQIAAQVREATAGRLQPEDMFTHKNLILEKPLNPTQE